MTPQSVLHHYPLPPADRVVPLRNAGGLSGAELWRVGVGPAEFCLRCWPEGTDHARVSAIQRVLRYVNLPIVPVSLRTTTGVSSVVQEKRIWTLEPWLPGQPVAAPSDAQLHSAMQALADFHRAAASYPGDQEFPAAQMAPPSGLVRRVHLTRDYLLNGAQSLMRAKIPIGWQALQTHRARLLPLFAAVAPRLLSDVEQQLNLAVPQQICLRDVWSAHLLYSGDEVTGLIDFDALRVDSVATDLARLLASYLGDDHPRWEVALDIYQAFRPLNQHERALVFAYDRFATLLTGMQWLDWILLQGKEFAPETVLARVDATLCRLEHLRDHLRI